MTNFDSKSVINSFKEYIKEIKNIPPADAQPFSYWLLNHPPHSPETIDADYEIVSSKLTES